MSKRFRNLPPIIRHFQDCEDPRIDRQKRHELINVIFIAICATLCGADGWVEIEEFGKAKKDFFSQFLTLTNGIPSHDTFARVFARLDPENFKKCFLKWLQCIRTKTEGSILAIDGKTIRNSFNKASAVEAIHMVSAWCSKSALVIGQVKVDAKSNEITAVPKLLELLELTGCIVTMDAMGCQKEHVKKIIKKNAEYVLALKGNQGKFHEEVVQYFKDSYESNFESVPHSYTEDLNKDHGRIEIRKYWLIKDLECFSMAKDWTGLKSVGMVESVRKIGDKTSVERRYYCNSITDIKVFAKAVRKHWGVENNLHWVLDVAFNEDKSRIRKDNAPENMSILRHIALNMLKKESSVKNGIKVKRFKAGWDNNYLLKVIFNSED